MADSYGSLEELGQVLERFQPEYWDGVELGAGSPEPWPEPSMDKRSRTIATESLVRYVSSERPIPPASIEQPFRPGDHFNAEALLPGTLLWIHQETLLTDEPGRPTPLRVRMDPPLPTASDTHEEHAVGHYVYQNGAQWGMVSATRRGEARLFQIPSHEVRRESAERIVIDGTIAAVRSKLTVGDVYHEGGKDLQRIYRVLGISVVGRAQDPDRRIPPDSEGRARIRDLFGRRLWRPGWSET